MNERWVGPHSVFLIGNKRSGTSHLVRLLNLHPQVGVTHESDIIWILYQMMKGENPQCYPWDGPLGMEATLKVCHDILVTQASNIKLGYKINDIFIQVERFLLENGSDVQEIFHKSELAWIGDKKPVQQVDPIIRPFIYKHFPQAHFLHIVRHPKAVVASMVEASMKWGRVAYWHQSPEKILERWAIHENWVLDAKQEGHPIHTIRLEDLSLHPMTSMKSVFEFLGLEIPEQVAQVIVEDTNPDPNSKYASFHLPHNDNAEQLMKYYNYTNE